MQSLVNKAHPHVIGLACVLHAFNNLAKDILNHPLMIQAVNGNKKIVNYFNSSAFFSEQLASWRKENGVRHGLQSACMTRWFTFAKVCLSVDEHELGLLKCVEMAEDQSLPTPSMPPEVRNIVRTCNHFTANKALVMFLKPVVDALARLERATTSLGDIWKEILGIYLSISKIDVSVWPNYIDFKKQCLSYVGKRATVYTERIYIIAFFLSPAYRQVAVSGEYQIKTVKKMLVTIAQLWGYSKADCINLKDQAQLYLDGTGLFPTKKNCEFVLLYLFLILVQLIVFSADNRALDYWLNLPSTLQTTQLKTFSIKVLELVAHAAGVESLFSDMGATKTKNRSRLTKTHLTMISQVRLTLLNHTKPKESNTAEEIQVVEESLDDFPGGFLGPEELEEFETGIFLPGDAPIDPFLLPMNPGFDGLISTLFDFDTFDINSFHSVLPLNANASVVDKNGDAWNPDDIDYE